MAKIAFLCSETAFAHFMKNILFLLIALFIVVAFANTSMAQKNKRPKKQVTKVEPPKKQPEKIEPPEKKPEKVESKPIDKLLTAEHQQIFQKAEKITFLRIGKEIAENIKFEEPKFQKINEKGSFHGYEITETVEIENADSRQNFVDYLFNESIEFPAMRCFLPRHGFRATANGKTVEILICFECNHFYAFDGKGTQYATLSLDMESGAEKIDKFIEEVKAEDKK